MSIGSVQLIAVAFPADEQVESRVLQLLQLLDEPGTMRVLDILVVHKQHPSGDLVARERPSGTSGAAIGSRDVEALGAAMEPGTSAGLVLIEHRWAIASERAVRATGAISLGLPDPCHGRGGAGTRSSPSADIGPVAEAGLKAVPRPLPIPRIQGRLRRFEQVQSLSVSVSEDVLLVDPVTLMPAPAAESALMRLRGDDRFRRRRHPEQLEVATRAGLTVADATREISAARTTLVECLRGRARIAAVGVHPATALDAPGLPCGTGAAAAGAAGAGKPISGGLRVRVTVGGAERALAVYNAARSYLPEIAALAANSPFLAGRDTGLASTRLKLAERAPHSGIPPAFSCWNVVEEFDDWATEAGLAPPQGNVSWDLRLSSRRGTLDFRIPDAQTQVRDLAAVTAVCQSLVAALIQRYDAGDELAVHESHAIARNRWSALRDGVDGVLLDLTSGTAVATRARLAELFELVDPHADRLGCRDEMAGAGLLAAENGAMRQRAVAATSGVPGLAGWLVEETEAL